jgi:hypothetical protein
MTCCEHHGINCNQGRTCPNRIKRALWPAIKETLARLAKEGVK